MKKNTLFAYALAPVLGLSLLGGASIASAYGMGMGGYGNRATPEEVATKQQEVFIRQAELLGVSVDDVKSAWATGKSFQTLAKEKGITAEALRTKMEAERKAQVTAELGALVSKGIITQAQADSRLKYLSSIPKEGKKGRGMMRHGKKMGW